MAAAFLTHGKYRVHHCLRGHALFLGFTQRPHHCGELFLVDFSALVAICSVELLFEKRQVVAGEHSVFETPAARAVNLRLRRSLTDRREGGGDIGEAGDRVGPRGKVAEVHLRKGWDGRVKGVTGGVTSEAGPTYQHHLAAQVVEIKTGRVRVVDTRDADRLQMRGG